MEKRWKLFLNLPDQILFWYPQPRWEEVLRMPLTLTDWIVHFEISDYVFLKNILINISNILKSGSKHWICNTVNFERSDIEIKIFWPNKHEVVLDSTKLCNLTAVDLRSVTVAEDLESKVWNLVAVDLISVSNSDNRSSFKSFAF